MVTGEKDGYNYGKDGKLVGGEGVFILDLVTLIMKDKILWIDDINEILSTETKAEDATPAEETTVEDAPVQETTDAE